jgi:general secretion pathway protein E
MIRPRLALATFALATLAITSGTQAADLAGIPFAQSASLVRGEGFYLNLVKFIPVLIIYLLWAWTTYWVDDDARELNNLRFEMWNSVVFFSGLLGFALMWAIPIYPISITLLLLAYFVPLMSYIVIRNQTVPDDSKVLTPYHIGEVMNDILAKVGMRPVFNRG